jgi:hypothetical protein
MTDPDLATFLGVDDMPKLASGHLTAQDKREVKISISVGKAAKAGSFVKSRRARRTNSHGNPRAPRRKAPPQNGHRLQARRLHPPNRRQLASRWSTVRAVKYLENLSMSSRRWRNFISRRCGCCKSCDGLSRCDPRHCCGLPRGTISATSTVRFPNRGGKSNVCALSARRGDPRI